MWARLPWGCGALGLEGLGERAKGREGGVGERLGRGGGSGGGSGGGRVCERAGGLAVAGNNLLGARRGSLASRPVWMDGGRLVRGRDGARRGEARHRKEPCAEAWRANSYIRGREVTGV